MEKMIRHICACSANYCPYFDNYYCTAHFKKIDENMTFGTFPEFCELENEEVIE